jgi:hypothetical protein
LAFGERLNGPPFLCPRRWEPHSALKDGNLYGEITGLVGSADNVKIFNLVQLYR